MSVDLSNRTHGKIGTYSIGCRCQECRIAKRQYRTKKMVAYRLAQNHAATVLRNEYPERWAELLAEHS